MNFSSRPSYRAISSDRRSNVRPTTDWTTSGSSRSASAVEPTRSANRAVANFRSLRRGSDWTRDAPHSLQNFAPSAFSVPHEGQMSMGKHYAKGSRTSMPVNLR